MMAKGSNARTAAQNAPRGIAPNMALLVGRFGTEGACERHMLSLRWPGGFECPRCGHRSCALARPQPPHAPGRDRWYKRDNELLSAWRRSQQAAP